ncbi:MAG TPA: hypothetical protein VGK46_11805 [Saprospiraceae bacterium]
MLLTTFGKPVDWQASRLASRRLVSQLKRHYLLILFVLLLPVMLARIKPNTRSVIWSDSEGYYQYLPALFILKDVHKLQAGSIWPYYNDKGEYVDKYTCGIAYFEWPFFLIARFVSSNLGHDPNDYVNPVYCNAIAIGGFCFAFFGLWILGKVLRRHFSEGISMLVIVSILFGTNFFHYATREMSISHTYSFFLFALFLYILPAWIKKPNALKSFIIGVILGWIVLIRPTNALIGILILLYDVYSMADLKTRFKFLLTNVRQLIWMIPGLILIVFPQLLYWKEMTGHWFYYSYTQEGFTNWKNPKIAEVLFDVQNGLFLYSPLVLLMIIGIFVGLKKKAFQAPALLLIFCIATYVFASWWAWWFGGAFGHRCYVEYYALLAIPLAGLFQHITTHWKLPGRLAFFSFVFVLMIFSVRLSYLYTSIGGPWDGPDWRWNWEKYEWVLSHVFP